MDLTNEFFWHLIIKNRMIKSKSEQRHLPQVNKLTIDADFRPIENLRKKQ